MLRRSTPRPERARVWRELWRRDKERALRVCDDIVHSRAVPQRLLDRLGVAGKMERNPKNMPPRKGKGSR